MIIYCERVNMFCGHNVYFVVLFLFLIFNAVELLNNGLALTPPMGWMSWGFYMCSVDCEKEPNKCLDENLVLSVADEFYAEGYQEAGYEYIIIDDCWSERERDSNGRLVPDRKRFPNGMAYIADYIHKRGLKFGMYTNIADVTCMRYPGSRGHFAMDAQQFADWGIDYLKVDGCFVEESYLNTAYIDLGKALKHTNRSIVYSCSWPYYSIYIHNRTPNYNQMVEHCNLWRNYHDVMMSWGAAVAIIDHYKKAYHRIKQFHGPGHWNDPDMVLVGNRQAALTESQSRIQLTVYMMMSAPILISCEMDKITPYEKKLLQNMDLIAIGQDPLGIMAEPLMLEKDVTMWVKRHHPKKGDQYYSYSFALVNMDLKNHTVTFNLDRFGLDCLDGYAIFDLFANKYPKNVTYMEDIVVHVPAEDVVLYTMYPL